MLLLATLAVHAESAKSILDKAAATMSNAGGVEARFEIISKQYGSNSGTIAIKGRKFYATTGAAAIWYDGQTQWTYMRQNEEVNISTPSEAEQQAINPYTFINIYKNGYRLSAKTVGKSYEVHLVATDSKRRTREMYIIVEQKTYHPTHVKMLQDGKWTVIILSHLRQANLSDDLFRFNSKDFPKAEVIDLR